MGMIKNSAVACQPILVAGVIYFLGGALILRADEATEKGRAIFKAHQQSVVTLELTIRSKMTLPGVDTQAREAHQEATGTVLDSSGLIVTALAPTDPTQMLENMLAGTPGSPKAKIETELTDVKILMADGSETPAKVVSRDKDLDLAFIRPTSKLKTTLNPVDLSNAGKAEILDLVVGINKLGAAADRAASASIERIAAIIEQPTRMYIPEGGMTLTGLGSPAFTLDGKVLGIFVTRAAKTKGAGGGIVNVQGENLTGVIVAANAVAKAAAQAAPGTEEKK